mgnify:CR=1 FL=1
MLRFLFVHLFYINHILRKCCVWNAIFRIFFILIRVKIFKRNKIFTFCFNKLKILQSNSRRKFININFLTAHNCARYVKHQRKHRKRNCNYYTHLTTKFTSVVLFLNRIPSYSYQHCQYPIINSSYMYNLLYISHTILVKITSILC